VDKRGRRILAVGVVLLLVGAWLIFNPGSYVPEVVQAERSAEVEGVLATEGLGRLKVAERASREGYTRDQFGSGWGQIGGCDTRNVILKRDLTEVVLEGCLVMRGRLVDPYTAKVIDFVRGKGTSSAVQIDHVVALSNAWGTGAQELEKAERKALANDPLNLLAVDGPENMRKGDKDASEWLPPNTAFVCQYVARQISVKYKYVLWVTAVEKKAMSRELEKCPNEVAIGVD